MSQSKNILVVGGYSGWLRSLISAFVLYLRIDWASPTIDMALMKQYRRQPGE
jgi:hypothetical protein